MSSWVKVTRGQTQKPPAVDKRHRPGWIPRLLDINPYKSYEKSEYAVKDGYPKEFEEVNSFQELFGKQSQYSTGSDDYERYQYSRKDDQYTKDNRREKLYVQFYEQIHKEYTKERPSDCVIVAINKEQTEYATVIGHQLQDHGLVVEMIYLASESGLTRALQEVKNDGSPFCILVEQSNVALSSCTVIMLHESIKITPKWASRANDEINDFGRDTVHRNMPMADALTLVSNAFGKIFAERELKERTEISHKAADLADDFLERELYGTYTVPLGIRHLLFLLSEGKYVYREELNSISDYLKTRKNELEGFVEKSDPTAEVNNTLYPVSIIAGAGATANTLSKPPPLLPTPSRTPLLGLAPLSQTKPPLLGERPGSLIPVPGIAGPKGKPPPLLAAPPTKRPGLLGFSPHQPVKRSFTGEKSGLLPTPDGMESATEGRLEKPPLPLPLLMATDTSKRMRLMGPRKESTIRPPLINFNPWSLGSIPYDGAESKWRSSLLGHIINSERSSDGAESNWRPSLLGHAINSERSSVLPLQHPRSAKPKPLMN